MRARLLLANPHLNPPVLFPSPGSTIVSNGQLCPETRHQDGLDATSLHLFRNRLGPAFR